jgi:hypothetical protein
MAAISRSSGRRGRATYLWLWVALVAAFALAVPGTASAMLSRFSEQPMEIRSGGRSVLTTGPVEWAPGEVKALFVVVVRQGDVVAIGIKQQQPPDQEWDVPVRVLGAGQLTPGPAEGTGTAVGIRSDGSVVTFVWHRTITLQ